MSKLLMGALVVLSVGVFSSCKDYDDEINEHKAQISALQSDLDKLKTAQENCAKECQDRKKEAAAAQLTADKAVKDAEAAQKAAEAAQKAADAAQGTADQAVKDAAAAQAAADAAQKAAEAAQAAADAAAALAKSEAAQVKKEVLDKLAADLADLEARIAQKYVTKADFEAELAKYTTTEDLNKLLAGVDKTIAKLREDMEAGDKTLSDKYEAVNKIVNEIYADYVKNGDLAAAKQYLDARIDGVVENVNTNKENIAVNAAAISVLQQQVLQIKINKEAIEALTGRVATIEADYVKSADLTNLQNTITAAYTLAIANATDALEKKLTDGILKTMQDAINANAQGVKTNKEAIDALTKAMNEANAAMTQRIDSLANVTKALEQNKLDKKDFDAVKNFYEKYGDKIIEVINWYTTVKDNVAKISTMLQDIENLKAQKLDKSVYEAKVKELENKDKELLGKITKNTEDITKLREDLVAALGRITAVENAIKSIKSDINKLFLFLDRDLTSIVTLPDTWLYGRPKVEAILVNQEKSFGYQNPKDADLKPAVGPNEAVAEASGLPVFPEAQFDAIEAKIMKEGAAKNVAFDINAKYWLNPNTVNVDNYTFSFDEIPTTAEITRGDEDNTKAEPIIKETKYSGDTLYVRFNVKEAGNVNNALTHGRIAGENHPTYAWVTTLALKATRKATNLGTETDGITKEAEANRRIISDYAILAPSYIDTLIVANGASYVTEGILHTMGNKQGHTWNKFAGCYNENADGTYSFMIQRTDENGVVNLNDSLRIHYTENGSDVEKIWTIKEAKEKGFDVKYTILTDKDYFDNNNGEISVKADKRALVSTAGKAAIVLVELTAGGVTQAYGYVSILITNDTTTTTVRLPKLKLNCESNVTSITWVAFEDSLEKALGITDWNEVAAYYDFKMVTEPGETEEADPIDGFQKYETADGSVITAETAKEVKNNAYGVINQVSARPADLFAWSFTTNEVLKKFFNADGTINEKAVPYSTWIKVEANAEGLAQGYQDIYVQVIIETVEYPTAKFMFGDRIQQYWFGKQSKDIASSPELRYEVHGNVEVPFNNNCDFNYSFSSTFDNQNYFVIYDKDGKTEGVEFGDPVTIDVATGTKEVHVGKAFFDQTKYHVLTETEAAEGKEIKCEDSKKATSIVTDADGNEYLLFINPFPYTEMKDEAYLTNIKTLWAVKKMNGKFTYTESATHEVVPAVDAVVDVDGNVTYPAVEAVTAPNVQAVVILDGPYNNIAKFQGKDDKKFDYARALLNKADHLELAAGETFTTHMLLDVEDYCLPIQWQDETNRFDIRYLRPISGEAGNVQTIIDAVNNGSDVYLADILNFQDWRAVDGKKDYHFSYATTEGMKYINYYGIKVININYADIESNISGVRKPIRLVTKEIKFEDNTGEWDFSSETPKDFRDAIGYFHYENNQSVVDDFEMYIPLSIEYYWGETAKQWVTLQVKRTTGQARQK